MLQVHPETGTGIRPFLRQPADLCRVYRVSLWAPRGPRGSQNLTGEFLDLTGSIAGWAEALSKISPVVLARSSPPLARRVTGAMKVSGLLRELDR